MREERARARERETINVVKRVYSNTKNVSVLGLDGELADGEVGSLLLGLHRQLSGVRRGEFPSEGARLLAADVQGLVHLPSHIQVARQCMPKSWFAGSPCAHAAHTKSGHVTNALPQTRPCP